MYKITSFIAIIALAAMSFSTQAQEIDQKPGKKNELAVDFSEVFTPNPSPGLIYKRHFTKGALRLRVNLNTNGDTRTTAGSSLDTTITRVDIETTNNSLALDIFIGYQWNRKVSEKFTVLYGFDAYMGISTSENQIENTSYNRLNQVRLVTINKQETSDLTYGLSPFIGFRYSLYNALSIGMESFWIGSTTQTTLTTTNTVKVPGSTSTAKSEIDPVSYAFSLKPTTLLVVSYYF